MTDDWDDWNSGSTPASAAAPKPSFGGRGRGISAPADDGWGEDSGCNSRGGYSSRQPRRGGGGRGGGGRGGDRGEDWTCSCGQSNFASRFKCFKCSEPKPGGVSGEGSNGWGRGGGGRGGDRGEDWTCSCGMSNFASRFKCFKCSEQKPSDGGSGGGSNGYGSGGAGGDSNSRPGDWKCSCGQKNFARREECFKCSEPKPEGAGNTNGSGGADRAPFDPTKPPLYVPKEMDDSEEALFSSGIQSGIDFNKWDNVEVKVSGDNPPKPIQSFETSGCREILLHNLKKSGYEKPTPIQKYAIAAGLDGRDIMACAQTGSGKTAAFLVPIMHHLIEDPAEIVGGQCAQPEVIICAPTRELVIQTFEVARKYAHGTILKVCMHYGGASSRYFNTQLEKGCHILVATTGRLKDILDRGRVIFTSVRFVVLDEADKMLDMGFKEDIQTIMQHSSMPDVAQRQTLMFSATFPDRVQQLAAKYMKNYIFIAVGIVGGASKDVKQTILEVSKKEKKKKLLEILRKNDETGVIVFVSTIRNADFLACYLCETEIATTSIHGQRLQAQREQAIADFKAKRMKVLVATAVASRGLDIKGVCHVINYDLPQDVDEYIHRIGRTGRVGNKGRATSFYDPEQDGAIATDLVRILQQADQEVPDFLKSGGSRGGGGGDWGDDGFGATDIRHGSGGGNAPVAAFSEENWD